MAFPGDEITAYYDGFRLGMPSGVPEATLGYIDGADAFVAVAGPFPMDEISFPSPIAVWSKRFTIPAVPPVFNTWTVLIKASVSAVERFFAFPVVVEQSPQRRLLAEVEGASVTTFGGWVVLQLRQLRRVTDRLKLSGELLDRLSRDRVIIQAQPKVIQQGEDATFEFTIIDEEAGGFVPLDGATIRFKAEFVETATPAWDVPASIIDASQGRAEAVVDSSLTGTVGQLTCQVEVTLPDTSVKLSPTFTITIEPSV